MALQLLQPDTLSQFLPGLAQTALNSDDTILRALGTQVAALAQEAFALTAVNAPLFPTGIV